MSSVWSARSVRSLSRSLLALALLAPAFTVAAQGAPPLRDLPKPSRELDEPYSLVAALREARGGLVVVADGMEGELTVVDFTTGARTALGRQGSGPGEYRAPGAVFRIRGDTLWVMDPTQQRFTVFLPDQKAGVPFHLDMFDTQTRTAIMAPFAMDAQGLMYSGALPVIGGGGSMSIPDSIEVIRFDPRVSSATGGGSNGRTSFGKLRFPTSGKPEMRVEGQVIHYKMAFPGLVTADSWAVFPDGRVAIVHGATYTVEFVKPDGSRTTSRPIAIDRIPVTAADKDAEMVEARRVLAEQSKAVQRSMPPGFTLQIEMTPPESWPASYPAVTPLAIFAAPDGMLWVRRATPTRLDRENWDVIGPTGTLTARWQLPTRTRLVGVGNGVVYTVRLDEDDLQYLARVPVR